MVFGQEETQCPHCDTKMTVDRATVELGGGIMACPKCGEDFEVHLDE